MSCLFGFSRIFQSASCLHGNRLLSSCTVRAYEWVNLRLLAIRSRVPHVLHLRLFSLPLRERRKRWFASCFLLANCLSSFGPARAFEPVFFSFTFAFVCLSIGRVSEPFDTHTAVRVPPCLSLAMMPFLRLPPRLLAVTKQAEVTYFILQRQFVLHPLAHDVASAVTRPVPRMFRILAHSVYVKSPTRPFRIPARSGLGSFEIFP